MEKNVTMNIFSTMQDKSKIFIKSLSSKYLLGNSFIEVAHVFKTPKFNNAPRVTVSKTNFK